MDPPAAAKSFEIMDDDSIQETSSLQCMYEFGDMTIDIADGDTSHAGSELSEVFSFRTRDALIKNFHALVAGSADLKAEDPFAFVAEHLKSNDFEARHKVGKREGSCLRATASVSVVKSW